MTLVYSNALIFQISPVSVESLEERTDKVENKEHLLLSLYEGHQPVSHQVEQATDLGFIGFQRFS